MTKRFIDFKTLRHSLDAHTILKRYDVKISRQTGNQFSVHCPFHEDKRPSMGVNAAKRAFKCHACGAGGNLLNLVTMLEGHDPKTSDGTRKGAEVASALVGLLPEAVSPNETDKAAKADKRAPAKRKPPKSEDAPQAASDPPKAHNIAN